MANILIIGKYYHPFTGGIEQNVRSIAEHVAGTHKVTVLVSNHRPGDEEETISGVTVKRRHVHVHYKGQPICLRMFKGVRFSDYDLIHFHSPNPYVNALFLTYRVFQKRKAPVIVTHHMDIFGRKLLRAISLPFLRGIVRIATTTIVTSAKNLTLSNDLPKVADYTVVPLALAPDEYLIDDGIRAAGAEWRRNVCGDAPVVGFVGRHARYKGLEVLMEALTKLPGVHAMIAGEGPYGEEVRKQAATLSILDRVHFLGSIDHRSKLKLLTSIDVFAFPSTEITEAFGISQMEAMLCECPVVASDLPTGVTDVAVAEKTALLAAPGDADALATQLRRMIDDKVLAKRLAAGGRQHILENMTQDIVARKTTSIFEGAVTGAFARSRKGIHA